MALAILLMGLGSCGGSSNSADLVLHNAHVVCLDGSGTEAQALAIRDGMVVAVGKEHEVRNAFRGSPARDLRGATVYPGLIDAHSHLLGYALNLGQTNLVGTSSWEEVLQRLVANHATSMSAWVRGRGWDQNDWPSQTFPDRAQLDSLFPNRPVALQRIDGHAVLANRAALDVTGLLNAGGIPGGEILRRADGQPTGVLIDGAADSLLARIPQPSPAQKAAALKQAQANLLAVGLTTVTDAGLDVEDIALLDSLHGSGDLVLRVVAMANPTEANFVAMAARGGWKTERLMAQSFKFYMDGALGSRGAALLEPYDDRPGHRGLLLQSIETYESQLRRIHADGFQAATHAIGDSAARLVLDVYERILGGPNDRRWRMEHAQVIHPDDVVRFGASSIIPSVQPTHATSDMYWAGQRLGRGRIRRAYAYADLRDQLGMLPLGTDFPVEDIDPRKTFLAAVARQDVDRYPAEGFHLDQALSPEECLLGMTLWAALACQTDSLVGSIEVGKRADLIVVDRDWLRLRDPHDVMSSSVQATYLDGELVYPKDNTPLP
ncbi:MAG: amidohydrolase [Flavobacteriales bacterium]